MADLVVIVPSRDRPSAAAELARAFQETCTADTLLLFAIGEDDPTLPEYERIAAVTEDVIVWVVDPTDRSSSMNWALNIAARASLAAHKSFALGFMGDDHRPRVYGWDKLYLAALRDLGTGIVYGDDLLQGERLPTQVAMTANIVRTLGYMAPPELWHMCVDNFWRDLGKAADCIRYLPDVVVEHLHPLVGKAVVDDLYLRSNSAEVYHHDETIYGQYTSGGQLALDVAMVRALRAAADR